MVRKIGLCSIVFALALCCLSTRASAYNIYDGNISNTYLTYFKDIINNSRPLDDYVFFRSGQYEYSMVVGDLDFSNGIFTQNKTCKLYTLNFDSSYNSNYSYGVIEVQDFVLTVDDELIYSNLGDYPTLIERGSNYETLILVLLFVIIIGSLIKHIFKFK